MGLMRIMAPKDGDKQIEWDRSDPTSVERARSRFNELTGQGYKAYHVSRTPGRTGSPVDEFSADAGELILAPPMSGG